MNQILQEEQRMYHQRVGKIERTHDILNELEQKMAGYHERKRTEEQLLMSQQQAPHPTKTKSTFKIFTKPAPKQFQSMQINELDESNKGRSKGQVGQLLQEVEAIEQLVRKKLALKEERVSQLERDVQLAGQQKIHLYKINCQLEQELVSLAKNQTEEQKRKSQEQSELEHQLKTLKQIYENKKGQNKRIKKDEQLLKETLKQVHQGRKHYHQTELKVIRSHSKGTIAASRPQNPPEEERYLRSLVGELDKLRRMVRSKMKNSASKNRIR